MTTTIGTDGLPSQPTPAEQALAVDAHKLLHNSLDGTSKQLKMSAQELANYTAERAAVLATLIGQKGFEQAVIVERDDVALKAAIEIGRQASGADQRVIGVIQSVLLLGAKALAGIP